MEQTTVTTSTIPGPRPAFPQPTPQHIPVPRDPQRSWDDLDDRPSAWLAFGED